MTERIKSPYQDLYKNHYLRIKSTYPSVFALKCFLGKNPLLKLQSEDFSGKKILDVGFGDGRDLRLFLDLGFDVYGIEVNEQVVDHTLNKFPGECLNLKVGYNDCTGFTRDSFDYIYSCAALMYLKEDTSTVDKTLAHMFDILKSGGQFLGTFTKVNSHITKNANWLTHNRLILKDPYYKQREGQLYHVHASVEEVYNDLTNAGFVECRVHNFDVDWFGTRETAYIFAAKKI